jgi:sucrose-6-phosphate hydrolase SacC (GH32 family)
MGWMSNWLYANDEPTSPWRGVQSLPRVLGLRRTPEGIRLVQAPVAEVNALRASATPVAITRMAPLPASADIELEVRRRKGGEAGVRLHSAAGENVMIGVAGDPPQVFVDRRRSRATSFHEAYPERHAGPVSWRGDRVKLRILFDRTTLEVFANEGETVISDRVYPTMPFERIDVVSPEGAVPDGARVFELKAVWDHP